MSTMVQEPSAVHQGLYGKGPLEERGSQRENRCLQVSYVTFFFFFFLTIA